MGGGGVFNRRLGPGATDEKAVRGEADSPVVLDGLFHRVRRGFTRRGVDDSKYLVERTAHRSLARPARHAFGNGVEIGHIARDVRAEHGIADRVEREIRTPLLEEHGLDRRPVLGDAHLLRVQRCVHRGLGNLHHSLHDYEPAVWSFVTGSPLLPRRHRNADGKR
jgi:hypothetical protein